MSVATYDLELVDELPLAYEGKRPKLAPGWVAPDSRRAHGTRAKYVVERCRCDACRACSSEYERMRSRAKRRAEWFPYVPAGRARQHVRELATQGVGLKTVAKVSGVSHGSLSRLMYGDPKRGTGPSKRVRRETANAILAVNAAVVAGAQKIPAGPTWKLLDELIALGYTKTWIARELGTKGPGLQIRKTAVRASTARKVEQLYRRVDGKPGPGRRSRWDNR